MQRERIATFSQGSGWKIRISIIPTATFGRLMLRKAHASAKMIQKTVFGRAVAWFVAVISYVESTAFWTKAARMIFSTYFHTHKRSGNVWSFSFRVWYSQGGKQLGEVGVSERVIIEKQINKMMTKSYPGNDENQVIPAGGFIMPNACIRLHPEENRRYACEGPYWLGDLLCDLDQIFLGDHSYCTLCRSNKLAKNMM